MTIIMIIMNSRGQSYGLWEADLWDLCLIFSIYGSVLLDSHWNQWDSFQQLPWSLAGSLNCLLKQGKINRAVGSSSADDWIDTLKFPSTFGEEAGKGQECRGGSCSADEQTAAFFLSDSFRASEEFHPMIFTEWCSGFDDLDPERTAYTPVENDTFLQRQNHFSFRADLGPRQLGHITVTDPASWASGGLCNQALCVKSLHALMVISPAAGTPHFFGIRRGSPELFTEELLLTHTAHRGQIPLHWPGGLANFSRDICITNQFHGLPFKEGCTLNYLVWIFPGCLLELFLACSYAQRLFFWVLFNHRAKRQKSLEEITVKPRGISWGAEKQWISLARR